MRWWGVWPPSKFWEASLEDQAFAIVAYETEMGIQAWDQHLVNIQHEAPMKNLSKDD